MNVTLGVSEIFEMAKDIESEGARFYREAAEKASSNEIKQGLLELAAMENGHLEIFEQMKKDAKFGLFVIYYTIFCSGEKHQEPFIDNFWT